MGRYKKPDSIIETESGMHERGRQKTIGTSHQALPCPDGDLEISAESAICGDVFEFGFEFTRTSLQRLYKSVDESPHSVFFIIAIDAFDNDICITAPPHVQS